MGGEIKAGIYRIYIPVENAVYIGQTNNFTRRWDQHKRLLIKNEHNNKKLQEIWNRYGAQSLVFEVIHHAPKLFDSLRLRHYLGLEEYAIIKQYKLMNVDVLNVTPGEVVLTKRANLEFKQKFDSLEKLRLEDVKNTQNEKTIRRREMNIYKDILLARSRKLRRVNELELNKIEKRVERLNSFRIIFKFGIFDAWINKLKQEHEKIQAEVFKMRAESQELKKYLNTINISFDNLDDPNEVFRVYEKIKRKSYLLRNQKSELKVKDAPTEVDIDFNRPSDIELDDLLFRLELKLYSVPESVDNEELSDDVLVLQRAAYHGEVRGYLGLSLLIYHRLLFGDSIQFVRYMDSLRHIKTEYKYKYLFYLLEAKILKYLGQTQNPMFYQNLDLALSYEKRDCTLELEVERLLDGLSENDAKTIRFKCLKKLHAIDPNLSCQYDLACFYIDGYVCEENVEQGLIHLKLAVYHEDNTLSFYIAYLYATCFDEAYIPLALAWYRVYKENHDISLYDPADVAFLESIEKINESLPRTDIIECLDYIEREKAFILEYETPPHWKPKNSSGFTFSPGEEH